MKASHRYYFLQISLIFISLLCLITGCGKGVDPQPESEAEKATKLLSESTWKLKTVMVDGTDQTDVYNGLTLTFTSTSFTSTHGGMVWPASGSWKFSDETARSMDRSDGLKISLQQISETNLSLGLTWMGTTLNAGRVNSVKGSHTFIFSK